MQLLSRAISRRTCGNAVAIVEKLSERMGTTFRIVKVFKNAKMHQIAGFCMNNLKIFLGLKPPDPYRSAPPPYLDPDTNFHLARQRSNCSCFTKRALLLSSLDTVCDSILCTAGVFVGILYSYLRTCRRRRCCCCCIESAETGTALRITMNHGKTNCYTLYM